MAVRNFHKCPRCGAPTTPCKSFAGPPSEFWLECTECNTYINTYIPQPHQEAVHKDSHTYVGNFGAFGTGKTLTSREEIEKHIFLTPNANILVGANITPQYEQTIKRELENDIPAAFVAGNSIQKSYVDFINGARIMYRPFDDPDKLRSLNLSLFVMVEASEVKAEVFHQLKTRLRNMSAGVQETDEHGKPVYEYSSNGVPIPVMRTDWRRGIIESNPDSGWIRTEVLLSASDIYKHGQVTDDYVLNEEEKDVAISAHVASTDVNKFLPATFIAENTKNKPGWWIARYIFSSFTYAEGLVYPTAAQHVVTTFDPPKEWKRICAFDYGLSDDAVFLWGAIDEEQGIVYIYRETRVTNRNVQELAKLFKEGSKDIPVGGWLTAPLIDPKSGVKRDYNKDSLMSLFLAEGINFKPGYINIDARVLRTNTYFESGCLKIMDCCTGLIKELKEYKFKPRTLDKNTTSDKPEDKNNHGINPLEWICMELPSDPKNILYGAYDKYGNDLTKKATPQNRYLPHALEDEDDFSIDRYANTAYGISHESYM